MPFIHETIPPGVAKRVQKDINNFHAVRFQVSEHPFAVFNSSGPEVTADGLPAAVPDAWRYYDARGFGSYVTVDGDGSGLNSLTKGNEYDLALFEKLNFIKRYSRCRKQSVSCRLVQLHAIHIQAIWELRNGETHCFHKAGFASPEFVETSPTAFYQEVAREWQAMTERYANSEHPELLGG